MQVIHACEKARAGSKYSGFFVCNFQLIIEHAYVIIQEPPSDSSIARGFLCIWNTFIDYTCIITHSFVFAKCFFIFCKNIRQLLTIELESKIRYFCIRQTKPVCRLLWQVFQFVVGGLFWGLIRQGKWQNDKKQISRSRCKRSFEIGRIRKRKNHRRDYIQQKNKLLQLWRIRTWSWFAVRNYWQNKLCWSPI